MVSLTSDLCLAQRFLFNISFIKGLLSKIVTLSGCGITLFTRMWKVIIFSWGSREGLREAEEKDSEGWKQRTGESLGCVFLKSGANQAQEASLYTGTSFPVE